jgi:chromate transporter
VVTWGIVRIDVPVWATIDWAAFVLSVVASVAMLRFKAGMLTVLGACVVIGGAWHLLTR